MLGIAATLLSDGKASGFDEGSQAVRQNAPETSTDCTFIGCYGEVIKGVEIEELPRDLNGKVLKRLLRESSAQPG